MGCIEFILFSYSLGVSEAESRTLRPRLIVLPGSIVLWP